MTTSTTTPRAPATQAPRPHTAWSGWIVFAGIMLLMVGTFQLIAGLVAIFQRHYYAVGTNGLVVHVSYTGWGWAHIILAVINIAAGFGLISGRTWARVWAIAVAAISAIVNLGFLAAYPLWMTLMISLDVIVIYALCVHWDEVRERY